MSEQVNIKISPELKGKIEQVLKDRPDLGFVTKEEFIKYSIERNLVYLDIPDTLEHKITTTLQEYPNLEINTVSEFILESVRRFIIYLEEMNISP